ncbi:MAG: DNA repair protein RecN [Pseudomonadota bacterium]
MLRALDIRDMLIIDRLSLEFQPGLNVLTGETGAGKSILLDSLGFVLGWRGRADLVRQGAALGEGVAVFDLPEGHAGHALLHEAGIPAGDELILRRTNTPDGRKTAYVNDRRCSGEVLRALSDTLVEVHGQHDDRGVLNPRGHRRLLDAFGGYEDLLAEVRLAWNARSSAAKTLSATEAKLDEMKSEEDFLRHAAAELDDLAPEPGEDRMLDGRRRLMQASERIRADIARTLNALGAEGAEGSMSDAARWLEGIADKAEGRLDSALDALSRARIELGEAQHAVETCLGEMDFDAHELESVEERLFAIRSLARKHGVTSDELADLAIEFRNRLEILERGNADLDVQRVALKRARHAYDAAAAALGAARARAAKALDKAMSVELAPLRMERAVFATEITPTQPGPEGHDAVAFTVATNPGAPSGPLNKIASGGELSRFLLALKVCLTADASGLTLIFDEIDQGVGGATADAVGRRLSALAEQTQVLIVTHSPQVAALGAYHWRVEKRVDQDRTTSHVVPLRADGRVDEIARMLSGDRVTDAARAAARALLKPGFAPSGDPTGG